MVEAGLSEHPTVACIVQARLESQRLPAKVLLPLPTGRSVIQEVMHRCLEISGVDRFVLAIPDAPESDVLDKHSLGYPFYRFFTSHDGLSVSVTKRAFQLYRGPEHDVLSRFIRAADIAGADIVMRITADCPCLDPEVCSTVLNAYRQAPVEVDYISNIEPKRTFPHGFDCEVFRRDMLDQSLKHADDHTFEHVTAWMRRSPYVRRYLVENADGDQSHIRLTLDTLADYRRIWKHLEDPARSDRKVARQV